MCTNPRLVSRRSSVRCDLSTSLRVWRGDKLYTYKKLRPSSEDFFYNNYLVPCGHCSQCLKKRQSDLAARCAAEANKRGSMVFVTLTYRDENLPLRIRLNVCDKSTGELLNMSSGSDACEFVPSGSELELYARNQLSKMDKSKCRYVYSDLFDDGDKLYRYCITPSLNRRDVQLWIKSCRVQYERELNLPLKKFSYVCCGEYGPNTKRPHYHLAFFGLSKTVVDWMCSRWNRKFGFTYVQQVNAVNIDGTNGFELCSRYIGKYMSKGCFECESVKNGSALKPRLMCSIGVGKVSDSKVINDNLLSYYRCYDIFGNYDINTGICADGSKLSGRDFDKLALEVSKRCIFKIGNSVYPIPTFIKHAVWYEKNSQGSYVSSFVRRQIVSRLQVDIFEDYVRKCSNDYSHVDEAKVISQINEFILAQFTCDSITEKRGFASLQKFYSNSKF